MHAELVSWMSYSERTHRVTRDGKTPQRMNQGVYKTTGGKPVIGASVDNFTPVCTVWGSDT